MELKLGTVVMIMGVIMPLILMADKADECADKCGADRQYAQDTYDGTFSCHYEDGSPAMEPKCLIECNGEKLADDQNKCTCEYCKVEDNHEGFCDNPGVKTHIGKGECDKLDVCGGVRKAKYRGHFCSAMDEQQLEEYKESLKD